MNAGGTLDDYAKATLRATRIQSPDAATRSRGGTRLISISRMTGCLSMGLFSKG